MSLSSSSTYADVKAAYVDNAGYDLPGGSVTMASEFILACRFLLSPQFGIKRSSHGGRGAEEVELDQTLIRDQLKDALAWLAANNTSAPAVIHPDFTGFRE